ncbi:hypothetical protein AHF37_08942 [Paragonimus kellicotti]|nr:hypothetical protein AHF37_08942 [Paragonimus kellicotti]
MRLIMNRTPKRSFGFWRNAYELWGEYSHVPPTSDLLVMEEVVVSAADVWGQLGKLIVTKAADSDNINPPILGPIADALAVKLASLFNRSPVEGKIPAD